MTSPHTSRDTPGRGRGRPAVTAAEKTQAREVSLRRIGRLFGPHRWQLARTKLLKAEAIPRQLLDHRSTGPAKQKSGPGRKAVPTHSDSNTSCTPTTVRSEALCGPRLPVGLIRRLPRAQADVLRGAMPGLSFGAC